MAIFDKIKGKKNSQNTNKNRIDPFKKPDTIDDSANNQNQNTNQGNQNQQGQQNSNVQQPTFADLLNKQNMFVNVQTNSASFIEAVRDNDVDKVVEFFTQILQDTAQTAIQLGRTITKTTVDAAINEATSNIENSTQGNMAESAMFEQLPFTKKNSKIAKDVLHGFLDQGLPVNDAIKGVKDYFHQLITDMGGDPNQLEATNVSNQNDNQQQNQNNVQRTTNPEEFDWVKELSSGRQSVDSVNQIDLTTEQQGVETDDTDAVDTA